jgi:hypothetical protein
MVEWLHEKRRRLPTRSDFRHVNQSIYKMILRGQLGK